MYNPFTFEAEHIETIHNHFHDSPNPIDWGTLHPALTNAAREIWSDPNCGVLDAAAIYIQYLVRSKAFGRQTGDTALVTGLLLMRLYGYGFVCTQQYLYNFVERAHITDRDTIALCLTELTPEPIVMLSRHTFNDHLSQWKLTTILSMKKQRYPLPMP